MTTSSHIIKTLVSALSSPSDSIRNDAAAQLGSIFGSGPNIASFHAFAVNGGIFKPLWGMLVGTHMNMRCRISAVDTLAALCTTQASAVVRERGFVTQLVRLTHDTMPSKMRQAATAALACIMEHGCVADREAVFYAGAIQTVIAALAGDGKVQAGALRALAAYARERGAASGAVLFAVRATQGGISALVRALSRAECSRAAVTILRDIAQDGGRDDIMTLDPVQAIASLLTAQDGTAGDKVNAAGLLHILAVNDADDMGTIDVATIREVVTLMASHRDYRDTIAVVALSALARNVTNRAAILVAGVAPVMVKVMVDEPNLYSVVAFMTQLATDQAGRDAIVRSDAVPELIRRLLLKESGCVSGAVETPEELFGVVGGLLVTLALDGVENMRPKEPVDACALGRLMALTASHDLTQPAAKRIIRILEASEVAASKARSHTASTGAEVGRQVLHALGIDRVPRCAYPGCWGAIHGEPPHRTRACCAATADAAAVRYCSVKCQRADWGCHRALRHAKTTPS